MSTGRRVRQLESCSRGMFGDLVLACQNGSKPMEFTPSLTPPLVLNIPYNQHYHNQRQHHQESTRKRCLSEEETRRTSILLDKLLLDIYTEVNSDYNSSTARSRSRQNSVIVESNELHFKSIDELRALLSFLQIHVERTSGVLLRRLKRRDALRRQQDAHCDVITGQLVKRAPEGAEALRFTIQPAPGESGFQQWVAAMKMVAQLSGGIPAEFRRRLWLTLADRHLNSRKIDWSAVERDCFSEWSHPADSELGVQIVKDLHRTGCSLFCGDEGQQNQALLKRVLLAYARWNKAVGYCQGFNMLAALILQVTDKCETDALKLMIYLIEGVLPDSYFADSLRGLSVDMAVFRELLRTRLPRLSRHLDALQNAAKDGTVSYEPPLTNVFTMQWFLTLFCNCLPQPTVLRVWDLVLLEGNEILLRTALAIWQTLADRILAVRSADEFYCIMGHLTRELLESNLIDGNCLIKAVVTIGPLNELRSLREHYMYNINPWGSSVYTPNNRQLKVYPKERLVLDIGALKKQYVKLKQRQRQAHIIFNAAISRQPSSSAPVAMNHLLLGKSALVPAKRLGPPRGSIPPARVPSTLHWKDTPKVDSSSSSSDTELCDDPSDSSSSSEDEAEVGGKKMVEATVTNQLGDGNLSDVNLMTNDNTLLDVETVAATTSDKDVISQSELISSEELTDTNNSSFVTKPLETGDIFDSSTSSTKTSGLLERASSFDFHKYEDSDDDSGDFDKFLEDRVRCLKEINLPSTSETDVEETMPDCSGRVKYGGRRNSERALQIIQENSLILHRIMQCQSRLSPSPPIVDLHNADDATSPVITDRNFASTSYEEPPEFEADIKQCETEDVKIENLNDFDTWLSEYKENSTKDEAVKERSVESELQSPQYGSRYTSILEKSRSLDEKYNSLILNASVRPFSKTLNDFSLDDDQLEANDFTLTKSPKEIVEEEFVINLPYCHDSNVVVQTDKESDISEQIPSKYEFKYFAPQDEPFDNVKKDRETLTLELPQSKSSTSPISESSKLSPSVNKQSSLLFNKVSPDGGAKSFKLTCNKSPSDSTTTPIKSPNKVFNPFPVNVSSRQNKEVPLKLGLYKK